MNKTPNQLIEQLKNSVDQVAHEVLNKAAKEQEETITPPPSVSLKDLENQIQARQLEDHYQFKKQIQASFHRLVIWILYTVPALIILGIIIIVGHWIFIGDFQSLENFIWNIAKVAMGAVIFKLAEYGVKVPKE